MKSPDVFFSFDKSLHEFQKEDSKEHKARGLLNESCHCFWIEKLSSLFGYLSNNLMSYAQWQIKLKSPILVKKQSDPLTPWRT